MATQSRQGKQMPMQTPLDLFVHELSDIYSAETIIVDMLKEAEGLTSNPQLKDGLMAHRRETEQQVMNLDQIFQQLGQPRHPVTCQAVKGLRQELKEAQQANPSPPVLDGVILDGAEKTEHYEIAAYTGLIKHARAMGEQGCAALLEQNLAQEQKMLQKLNTLGDQMTQQFAAMMPGRPGAGQQSSPPM